MGRRARIGAAAALLLLIGYLIAAVILVPRSCYTSPGGKMSRSDWVRQAIQFDFQECDPFASLKSSLPIGELSILYSFESGSIVNAVELRIEPDGTARIIRNLDESASAPVRLTSADYNFFRDRLSPLRDYSQTDVVDRPEESIFDDPSRKAIRCESSSSLAPNGLTIIWNWDRYDHVEAQAGSLRVEDLSAFDLGCEGTAGPALRARTQPVTDRLKALARKWAPLPYEQ